jgi:hypothetical protein
VQPTPPVHVAAVTRVWCVEIAEREGSEDIPPPPRDADPTPGYRTFAWAGPAAERAAAIDAAKTAFAERYGETLRAGAVIRVVPPPRPGIDANTAVPDHERCNECLGWGYQWIEKILNVAPLGDWWYECRAGCERTGNIKGYRGGAPILEKPALAPSEY